MCNTLEARVAAVRAAVDETLAKINFPENFPLSTFKAVETVADSCGWDVGVDDSDGTFTLSFGFRNCEEDYSIEFSPDSLDRLVEDVHDAYENYDTDYETYIWLDSTGHGSNGAPYRMRDLLEDKEAIEKGLEDLWLKLSRIQSSDFQPKEAPDGFTKDDLSEIARLATWNSSGTGFRFEWNREAGWFGFTYQGGIKAELYYQTCKFKSMDDLVRELGKSLDAVKAWLATKADLPLETCADMYFVSRHVSDYAKSLGCLRDSLADYAKTAQAVQDSAQ